jgi:hypothetical protein
MLFMDCGYENCKINDALNKVKHQLQEAISDNFSNYLISDIVKISKSMDDLIERCMSCKTNNRLDALDIHNIAGRHSMFFYYSKEHLLVCLAQYLKTGIDKNEFCPVFLQPDWYQSLFKYFRQINLPSRNIQHYPVNEMLESFTRGGASGFREKVMELTEWTKEEGFTGIRMIGQCSYAIALSSKKEFLKFEKAINDAFCGTSVGGLCVYDFNDFINTSQYIDDEILYDSFKTHTNMYYPNLSYV